MNLSKRKGTLHPSVTQEICFIFLLTLNFFQVEAKLPLMLACVYTPQSPLFHYTASGGERKPSEPIAKV